MTSHNAPDALTHVNQRGEANMVNVSAKPETHRVAICEGWVLFGSAADEAIRADSLKKGDVIATSRIAGLMAVKRAADLIPLCHPIRVSKAAVDLDLVAKAKIPTGVAACHANCAAGVKITTRVEAVDRTGVEMEAMTALSVAALTMYDMLKAVDRSVVSSSFRLLHKSGGKSGEWNAPS